MIESDILLNISGLEKAFGSVKVLTGIDLTLHRGEILGLVGENGAGKSTFARCVSGRLNYHGSIEFHPENAAVYVIPQEFNLIPTMSVYENIFLGREQKSWGLLKKSVMRNRARELLENLHSTIDPETPADILSVAEKQMVEIAKAFLLDSALLIMDEPTTVLNRGETELLFEIIRSFRARGGAVIYISHKLEEVREICDSIAVLRDGVLVSHAPAKTFSALELAEKMVGRELSQVFPPKIDCPPDAEVVLKTDSLCALNAVRNVSFVLHRGEILGLAGLAGAGRSELAETLCGLRRKTGGRVWVFGREVHFRKPSDAVKAGLSYLSEDRQGTAVLTDFSVSGNTTLSSLGRYTRLGLVNETAVRRAAADYVSRFGIKTESLDTKLRNLSGGNQQKVAIAKGLDTNPRIFIFDEPTRGVDVGARGEIYQFIHDLAEAGVSCLLISSDLEEIIGNCRRVLVMRTGEAAGELEGADVNEQRIMYLATGVKQQ